MSLAIGALPLLLALMMIMAPGSCLLLMLLRVPPLRPAPKPAMVGGTGGLGPPISPD